MTTTDDGARPSDLLRFPLLLFGYVVSHLRRIPGARFVAPFLPWVARGMLVAAGVLLLLWGFEASPQRLTLAQLTQGELGRYQTWIIVSGDLALEPGSTSTTQRIYRLTDPNAPNAFLSVRSSIERPLGPTTLSGHIEGGRDGVPPGYAWSARLTADPVLAQELPPPMTSFVLIAAAVMIIAARRSRYPRFLHQRPAELRPGFGRLRVTVRADDDLLDHAALDGTLDLGSVEAGAAGLQIAGRRPIPVRLHSAFSTIDVGRLLTIRGSTPALRLRSAQDDLSLAFASASERDTAFATLSVEGAIRN